MHPAALVRAAVPALLLSALATPDHAHAQEHLRIGNVRVLAFDSLPSPARDPGYARVKPDGDLRRGDLVWACGGDSAGLAAGIHLANSGRTDSTRQVVWAFDRDPPRPAVLRGGRAGRIWLWSAFQEEPDPARKPVHTGEMWLLGAEDAAWATARARKAERLVVEVPGESPSQPATKYVYRLAGVDSALARLGCGAVPRPDERRAGVETLHSFALVPQGPDSTSGWELAVMEVPELANLPEVRRALERNYPPTLRDAGVSGRVELSFRVREDGHADSASIRVVRLTHAGFDSAAVRVVTRMRFRPARLDGRPVKTWVQLPIWFQIADSGRPAAPGGPASPRRALAGRPAPARRR